MELNYDIIIDKCKIMDTTGENVKGYDYFIKCSVCGGVLLNFGDFESGIEVYHYNDCPHFYIAYYTNEQLRWSRNNEENDPIAKNTLHQIEEDEKKSVYCLRFNNENLLIIPRK